MINDLFSRNGLSLDRLRVLVDLHGAESLIKAAKGDDKRAALYVRQIAELEKFFGFRLVRREGRRVVLNDEGEEIARVTADFFRGVDDLLQRGRGRELVFRIGAGESLLQWIVVPRLSAVTTRLPQAGFRLLNLQNHQIVLGLEDRTLDFGLVRKESLRKPLQSTRLGTVGYNLCVPRHMLKPLKGADWREMCARLPLAVHLETTYVQAELDAALDGLGIQPSVRLRCCSFPASMAALKTGKYATLMIRFPGADPLPEDVEIVPLPCLEHTNRDIHLAWNPRLLQIRPEAERIRAALHEHLAWSDD